MSCACMTACMPIMQVEGLLPAHAVDLVKTGGTAADGVQFCFAAPAAARSGHSEATGQTALGRLSGGERTLVSLALLLAVSLAASPCAAHYAKRARASGSEHKMLSDHVIFDHEAHSSLHINA